MPARWTTETSSSPIADVSSHRQPLCTRGGRPVRSYPRMCEAALDGHLVRVERPVVVAARRLTHRDRARRAPCPSRAASRRRRPRPSRPASRRRRPPSSRRRARWAPCPSRAASRRRRPRPSRPASRESPSTPAVKSTPRAMGTLSESSGQSPSTPPSHRGRARRAPCPSRAASRRRRPRPS